MNRDTGARAREHAIDWLEMAADLPHLFARLSELVHGAGYAPEDIVLIPRSELDRRETAAFTAGWAEAMAEDLPRLRREYEKRIAEAYAAGTTGRRSGPRGQGHGQGAEVIRLPFAALVEPPAPVREAEERMRHVQALLGRQSDEGHAQAAEDDEQAAGRPRRHDGPDVTGTEQPTEAEEQLAEAEEQPTEPTESTESAESAESDDAGDPGDDGAAGDARASAEAPLSAQQVREKRTPPTSRKVVRRNGRPIVPPLEAIPVQPRPHGQSAESQGTGGTGRRSLTSRARALADDIGTKAGGTRPVAPEGGR